MAFYSCADELWQEVLPMTTSLADILESFKAEECANYLKNAGYASI